MLKFKKHKSDSTLDSVSYDVGNKISPTTTVESLDSYIGSDDDVTPSSALPSLSKESAEKLSHYDVPKGVVPNQINQNHINDLGRSALSSTTREGNPSLCLNLNEPDALCIRSPKDTDVNSVPVIKVSSGSNNGDQYESLQSENIKRVNVQKILLAVPHAEHSNNQKSKSFYGFKPERPPTCSRKRRTVSKVLLLRDSSNKYRDTWSAAANRCGRLNTILLEAIENHDIVEVESMLYVGANPNATCRTSHISACHAAALADSSALHLLLKFNIDKARRDKFGRTPLHLAAWAGKTCNLAMLLDFPVDLQHKVALRITSEIEDEIKTLNHNLKSLIDVPCELPLISVLPQSWKDSIEHKCRRYMTQLPKFFSGWTPLHIASYAGHHNATRLLLAAGANPNSKDAMRQTPLDIAGAACYLGSVKINKDEYVNTIKALIEYGGKANSLETFGTQFDSALHTAVELCSVEAIQLLLNAGAAIWHRNAEGNTPLHECVLKYYKEPLQVLANHAQKFKSMDVLNRSGYTVLHAAIMASWVPGVCIALDGGANVMLEAHDGKTALHLAALQGNLNILDEILLNAAQYENAVNHYNGQTEPAVFCAIRSGNIDCVLAFLDADASLKMIFYNEPTLGDTTMEAYILSNNPVVLNDLNMILHATAEAGNADILELLLKHDKSLEKLLEYRCPYLKMMTPVEFAAYHDKFFSFRFLLQKTLKRAKIAKVPFDNSRLLDIISTLNREELLRELVREIPNAVRMMHNYEYFPLHNAARGGHRNLIRLLIEYGADLALEDKNGVSAISVIIAYISRPIEYLEEIFDNCIFMNLFEYSNYPFSTMTVDYSILIPYHSDTLEDQGQMTFLTSLLECDNRRNQRKLLGHPLIESFLYLKWQTLSSYFYLMVLLYFLFAMSLSVFIVSTFYFMDKNISPNYPGTLWAWNPRIWKYCVYVTFAIVVTQELSCSNLRPHKWTNKLISKSFWVKFVTYTIAIVLPFIMSVDDKIKIEEGMDWRRNLATATLVVAWLNIMMLLSNAPTTGYYMQMFWIVSVRIIKVLLTFFFVILVFSFGFMVQFHAQVPFDGPWASVVKTLVMMTSEFDYSDTFSPEKAKNLSTNIQLLRVVFVVFLILTAIVLMNLTIGVAAHDIQNLMEDGNLKRLDRQVRFLNRLEVSRAQTSFFHFLGLYRLFGVSKVPQTLTVKLVNDSSCCFTPRMKENLLNIAQEQIKKIDRERKAKWVEIELNKITRNMRDVEQSVLRHINELKSMLQPK